MSYILRGLGIIVIVVLLLAGGCAALSGSAATNPYVCPQPPDPECYEMVRTFGKILLVTALAAAILAAAILTSER